MRRTLFLFRTSHPRGINNGAQYSLPRRRSMRALFNGSHANHTKWLPSFGFPFVSVVFVALVPFWHMGQHCPPLAGYSVWWQADSGSNTATPTAKERHRGKNGCVQRLLPFKCLIGQWSQTHLTRATWKTCYIMHRWSICFWWDFLRFSMIWF